MTEHEGPKLIVIKPSYSCEGCVFHETQHWSIEDGNDYDWGYHHNCKHESVQQPKLLPRRIGDSARTPDWCPFLAASGDGGERG